MTAEQKVDHMLQMMSQTQTEMRQGQSDTRADMNAMYGELKSIREEQLEANKTTLFVCSLAPHSAAGPELQDHDWHLAVAQKCEKTGGTRPA